jgi:hypothetical protein
VTPGAERCGDCRYNANRPGAARTSEPTAGSFDQRWHDFNNYIGRTVTDTRDYRSREATARPDERVILHVSDLHIPFMDRESFARAVAENPDATDLDLGGDIFNANAASRFVQTEVPADPVDELAETTALLQWAAGNFRSVRLRRGNHVDRIRKFFAARVPPEMMFLVNGDPLRYIVAGLRRDGIENIELAEPIIAELPSSNWLSMVGDCVFAHAETSGAPKLKPAENLARFLRRWSQKLPSRPRVVVQEHNHVGGKAYDPELDALLIQAPCMSADQDYQFTPDLRGKPNQIGYVRIVQRAGVTDWNRSNFFLF